KYAQPPSQPMPARRLGGYPRRGGSVWPRSSVTPPCWEQYVERRSLIRHTFGPGPSPVAMNDPTNVGETDTGSFKLVGSVQSLEHPKQFGSILHVESHTIVADEKDDFRRAGMLHTDLYCGERPCARKLHGICDQVHKYLSEHGRIALHFRQCSDCP